MPEIEEVLANSKKKLLSQTGTTAVGIGYKRVNGEVTDQMAIVVFVKEKKERVDPGIEIPKNIDGHVTDVVEHEFGLEHIATDPFARFERLFSGISLTPLDVPLAWGTIGCIIQTTGNEHVEAGNYVMTCRHVLKYADPDFPSHTSTRVLQPGHGEEPPPPNYNMGNYVYGVQNAQNDCAIATIEYDRTWRNEIPNAPWRPGRKQLTGIAQAAVGEEVYKYGATTKYTRGVVQYIHLNVGDYNIQDSIYVTNVDGTVWAAKGDSGSVLVRTCDDRVIGLNFAINPQTVMDPPPQLPDNIPGYTGGYAYDIQSQMNNFGWNVKLAEQ